MKKIQKLFVRLFKATTGDADGLSLSEISLLVLVFLLPILIVPQFVDMHGTGKQVLLIVLSSLALFSWTLRAYRYQSLVWSGGISVWFPVVMLLGVGVSSAMSESGFSSWVGMTGQGFTAFVPFLAMLTVYVLTVQLSSNVSALRRLSFALLFGTLLLLIYGVFEFFGVSFLSGGHGFAGFSLSGTFESMVLLGTTMSLLFAGIWIVADKSNEDTWMPTKNWRRSFITVGTLVTLITLFFIVVNDRWPSEVVMLAGSGFIIALGLFDPIRFRSPSRLLLPMLFVAVSLLLLLFRLPIGSSVPVEVAPSFNASWQIAVDTFKTDGVFGSGPNTWRVDFTRFKPDGFSMGNFWQVGFDHANSSVLTLLATWGLVPVFVFLVFILWILKNIFTALILRREREEWQTVAILSSVWFALAVSKVVYSSDIVIETFFWMFTGLLVARIMKNAKLINFDRFARTSLLTSFAIVFSGIAFVFSLVISTQWMIGEVSISRAAALQMEDENVDDIVKEVERAVSVNRWNADYRRALAVAHLNRVNKLAEDVDANAQLIVQGASFAENMAGSAISLEPLDVRGYELLGSIYSSLSSVIAGSDALALNQYRAAVALDPVNPIRHIRLARALINSSDKLEDVIEDEAKREEVRSKMLSEAEGILDKAAELKPNYAPTFYTRALTLERQDKLDDAIEQMVVIVANSPQDPVIRFELGVLQLRAGNKDLALQDFQVAVKLAPTYANARWYLVALYEEMGETDAAIDQLEALNTLNPDDQVVLDKLNLMRAGTVQASVAEEVEPLEGVEPVSE